MAELVDVDEIPDSAVEAGFDVEFVENDRLVIKWQDRDGTLYSEEYERTGQPKKEVSED